MCLSLPSFYLGARRHGENVCCCDAKTTEQNFIAQSTLDSVGPSANCRKLVAPQTPSHWFLLFFSQAVIHLRIWMGTSSLPYLPSSFHYPFREQLELEKTFGYLSVGAWGCSAHSAFTEPHWWPQELSTWPPLQLLISSRGLDRQAL